MLKSNKNYSSYSKIKFYDIIESQTKKGEQIWTD